MRIPAYHVHWELPPDYEASSQARETATAGLRQEWQAACERGDSAFVTVLHGKVTVTPVQPPPAPEDARAALLEIRELIGSAGRESGPFPECAIARVIDRVLEDR